MSSIGLPDGDVYEQIHLGGETAVVVPLKEYRSLRAAALYGEALGRKAAEGTIRQTSEEFLETSGLTDQEKQHLRGKYGLPGSTG